MTMSTPDYQPYLKGTAIERDFATRRELPVALAQEFVRAGLLDALDRIANISRILILDRLFKGCSFEHKEACIAEMTRLHNLGRNA